MANEKTSFEDRFEEIGAIWLNDAKGILSFKLKENATITPSDNIVAFRNKFRNQNAKAPDFRLFLDKKPAK